MLQVLTIIFNWAFPSTASTPAGLQVKRLPKTSIWNWKCIKFFAKYGNFPDHYGDFFPFLGEKGIMTNLSTFWNSDVKKTLFCSHGVVVAKATAAGQASRSLCSMQSEQRRPTPPCITRSLQIPRWLLEPDVNVIISFLSQYTVNRVSLPLTLTDSFCQPVQEVCVERVKKDQHLTMD